MRTRTLAGVVLLAVARFTLAETDPRNELLLAAPAHMGKEAGTPLDQVVDHLRDKAGRSVFVNWRVVEGTGIKRTVPVTVDLTGLTVGEAAAKLVKQFEDTPLAFEANEGVLTISTPSDLAFAVETRTYDVRTQLGPDDAERPARVETLVRRVQGVNPMSWKANGGRLGQVHEVGGQLIVTHTLELHRRVALELGEGLLREQQTALMRSATAQPESPLPVKVVQPAARAAPQTPVEVTAAAMKKSIPDVRLDSVSLGDAFDFFRDMTKDGNRPGVTFDIEWKELAKANITRESTVSTRLRNVYLNKCLRVILPAAAKPADKPLVSIQSNGHVLITTKRDTFARFAVVERYPLGDLIKNSDPAAMRKQIPELIIETINTDSWAGADESIGGTLILDGDTMVATQTPDAQAQIATLLMKLREAGPAAWKN